MANFTIVSDFSSVAMENAGKAFPLFMVLGVDIVSRALAKLAGSGITPVAFSFGWAAYAFSVLLSVLNGQLLMPSASTPGVVIDASNGLSRQNSSWVIGRLISDFEAWKDHGQCTRPVYNKLAQILYGEWSKQKDQADTQLPGSGSKVPKPQQAGLCVSVYRAGQATPGRTSSGFLHYLGFATALVQQLIAVIPCIVSHDSKLYALTTAAVALSFCQGNMQQYASEKWACRRNSKKTIVLTHGNGAQHAIVIIGDGKGLDLEDLATGPAPDRILRSSFDKPLTALIAVAWISLTVAATGLGQNAWYMFVIAAVGFAYNVYVAGTPCSPEQFGMPLHFEQVVATGNVMQTLFAVEEQYPGVGKSMLSTFCPGQLRPDEVEKWQELTSSGDTGRRSRDRDHGADT